MPAVEVSFIAQIIRFAFRINPEKIKMINRVIPAIVLVNNGKGGTRNSFCNSKIITD